MMQGQNHIRQLYMHPVYTELQKGTKMWQKVDLYKFLENFFVHLDNKDNYSIFKDKLYSLCFITNKLLVIKEIFKFVQKLFMFFMKVVQKIKYCHKNPEVMNPGLGIEFSCLKVKYTLWCQSEAKVIAELQSNDGMKSSVPLTRWEVRSGTGEDSCPVGYNTMYGGNCVLEELAASFSLSV